MKYSELKEKITNDIKYERDSLGNECRALGEFLLKLEKLLKSDKPYNRLCINDFGEIQSRGTMIDARCGRLMAQINILGLME